MEQIESIWAYIRAIVDRQAQSGSSSTLSRPVRNGGSPAFAV